MKRRFLALLLVPPLLAAAQVAPSTSSKSADTSPAPRTNSRYRLEREHVLEWNLKISAGAYEQVAKKNSKWDAAARQALTEYARIRTIGGDVERRFELHQASQEAISAGCDDPMIAYLVAFLNDEQDARTRLPAHKSELRSVADRLLESAYPAVCKFWAASRAGRRDRTRAGSVFSSESLPYRQKAQRYLVEMIEEPTTPTYEIVNACRNWLEGIQGDDGAIEQAIQAIEPAVRKHSTNAYFHHLIKGVCYFRYGWSARGSGYADKVTDKGWELFGQRLKIATTEFEAAWKLNPEEPATATAMISVEMGLGGEKDAMERWFQRAMQADADNYRACLNKLTYLEPKWNGSPEEMLAFARQCARSTNYGGQTPLILYKAHDTLARYLPESERNEYWKQDGIWKEIKAAFDKYFRASPWPDTSARSRLLLVAYRTREWAEFIKLYSEMKVVDDSVFGGKDYFDRALAYVKSRVAQTKTAQ